MKGKHSLPYEPRRCKCCRKTFIPATDRGDVCSEGCKRYALFMRFAEEVLAPNYALLPQEVKRHLWRYWKAEQMYLIRVKALLYRRLLARGKESSQALRILSACFSPLMWRVRHEDAYPGEKCMEPNTSSDAT